MNVTSTFPRLRCLFKQTKVLPGAKRGNSENPCLQPPTPQSVSPAVGCDIVNTSDLKNLTALYFWKLYHTFISLKNILNLLQATRCLDFITGSKVATKENQNNLQSQHDCGTKQIQSYTPMQNMTTLRINILFELLPLNWERHTRGSF